MLSARDNFDPHPRAVLHPDPPAALHTLARLANFEMLGISRRRYQFDRTLPLARQHFLREMVTTPAREEFYLQRFCFGRTGRYIELLRSWYELGFLPMRHEVGCSEPDQLV